MEGQMYCKFSYKIEYIYVEVKCKKKKNLLNYLNIVLREIWSRGGVDKLLMLELGSESTSLLIVKL